MRSGNGAVVPRWREHQDYMDSPRGASTRDRGVPLRMQLPDDFFEPSEARLDLDKDDVVTAFESNVNRSPARSRHNRLRRRPPRSVSRGKNALHDPGVGGIENQWGPFAVQLDSEIRAETGARARSDRRSDACVTELDPADDISVDTNSPSNGGLRNADAQPQLPEVVAEAPRRSAQFAVARLDRLAAECHLHSTPHGAHLRRVCGRPDAAGREVNWGGLRGSNP